MPASNPFASQNIRPGVVPYLFAANESAAAFVERLQASDWWGQIIGPHGSGKSTLLVSLLPEVERAGRQPRLVTLHQGQHRVPPVELDATTLLIVDGYEQLSWWSRQWTKFKCRRARSGLLVTAHADVGLPMLLRTAPTVELAQQVASHLLASDQGKITRDDIAAAFAATEGNIRETLFKLYDMHQERQ